MNGKKMTFLPEIISGGWVAESSTWAPYFDFTGVQLTWMLVGYGFVAAGGWRCMNCW
jgi:carbon starvation protein CstA